MYLRIRYTTKVYIHVDGSNTKTSQIIKYDITKVDEKTLWKNNGEQYLFYLQALSMWSFRGNIDSFATALINICYYYCYYYCSRSFFSVLNTVWCYLRETPVILFSFMLNLCPQTSVGICIRFLELHKNYYKQDALKQKKYDSIAIQEARSLKSKSPQGWFLLGTLGEEFSHPCLLASGVCLKSLEFLDL